jgi:hypothetical protein
VDASSAVDVYLEASDLAESNSGGFLYGIRAGVQVFVSNEDFYLFYAIISNSNP